MALDVHKECNRYVIEYFTSTINFRIWEAIPIQRSNSPKGTHFIIILNPMSLNSTLELHSITLRFIRHRLNCTFSVRW